MLMVGFASLSFIIIISALVIITFSKFFKSTLAGLKTTEWQYFKLNKNIKDSCRRFFCFQKFSKVLPGKITFLFKQLWNIGDFLRQ